MAGSRYLAIGLTQSWCLDWTSVLYIDVCPFCERRLCVRKVESVCSPIQTWNMANPGPICVTGLSTAEAKMHSSSPLSPYGLCCTLGVGALRWWLWWFIFLLLWNQHVVKTVSGTIVWQVAFGLTDVALGPWESCFLVAITEGNGQWKAEFVSQTVKWNRKISP